MTTKLGASLCLWGHRWICRHGVAPGGCQPYRCAQCGIRWEDRLSARESGNPARVVWRAMALLERDHGGPRKTSTADILRVVKLSPSTVRRALYALQYAGIAEVADDTRGQRKWRLLPPGRAKYGLPNVHKRVSS